MTHDFNHTETLFYNDRRLKNIEFVLKEYCKSADETLGCYYSCATRFHLLAKSINVLSEYSMHAATILLGIVYELSLAIFLMSFHEEKWAFREKYRFYFWLDYLKQKVNNRNRNQTESSDELIENISKCIVSLKNSCLVPDSNGIQYRYLERSLLWDNYCTNAPQPVLVQTGNDAPNPSRNSSVTGERPCPGQAT